MTLNKRVEDTSEMSDILKRLTALESAKGNGNSLEKIVEEFGKTIDLRIEVENMIERRLTKLEEAVKFLMVRTDNQKNGILRLEEAVNDPTAIARRILGKPTCKTCGGSGYKDGVVNWGNTCPDCAKKKWECPHMTSENGLCSDCGEVIFPEKDAPKTSCTCDVKATKLCPIHGEPTAHINRRPADPQPERTPNIDDYNRGYKDGRNNALEELRMKIVELFNG